MFSALVASSPASAEDGYRLWLRFSPLFGRSAETARADVSRISGFPATSETLRVAEQELQHGLKGLMGKHIPLASGARCNGSLVLARTNRLRWNRKVDTIGPTIGSEGYFITSARTKGKNCTIITANSDIGLLYGTFGYLRQLQLGWRSGQQDVISVPKVQVRILDHWDNLDGTVERGFAGRSIFNWHLLPGWVDPRIRDYARANASIGINGIALNNVNADAIVLTRPYLKKAAALADVFRPYGIKVYLSASFAAPMKIGGLKDADPLDPAVRNWWRQKADEIYSLIPDFGGFLVKANSEGQPGPQDYNGPVPAGWYGGARVSYRRTHADGANLLASALNPHHGIVMWRAFVYEATTDERAKRAYDEFKPLDGKFLPNVSVQVKYGPLDFQPREAAHPLLGAMPHTNVGLELQITKEYLGQATHLVYLGPLWKEVLSHDTVSSGPGATVARIVDGELYANPLTVIAGVANVGTDRNWTGSQFDQANWYAFGRLSWNNSLTAKDIAREWVAMTFSRDPDVAGKIVDMMLRSHQTAVDYMAPLGLAWTISADDHYSPAPWSHADPTWGLVQYDRKGIGFERSSAGSNAVAQYSPVLRLKYENPSSTPEDLLLWFHHIPWDYRMPSGSSLWEELLSRYDRGVRSVGALQSDWASLRGKIDEERFEEVSAFLAIQRKEAQWWRDANVAYFQHVSELPLPPGTAPPAHPLAFYQNLSFPYAPGVPGRTSAPFLVAAQQN